MAAFFGVLRGSIDDHLRDSFANSNYAGFGEHASHQKALTERRLRMKPCIERHKIYAQKGDTLERWQIKQRQVEQRYFPVKLETRETAGNLL